MEVFWFIPTHGDGRYLGSSEGARAVDAAYMRQIAQAVDRLGYSGVLLPTGKLLRGRVGSGLLAHPGNGEAQVSRRAPAGLQSPTVAAGMAATFDRISHGRLLINVVTGGDPTENKGDGIFLPHDDRYAVTREFLAVFRDLLAGKVVNFHGEHIRIEDGRLTFPALQKPYPPLYFRRIFGYRNGDCRGDGGQISDMG